MANLLCEGVSAAYGEREVLHEIDLGTPSGSLAAILGASGSGKTTLLRVIAGFVRASAGRVVIGDTVVAGPGLHTPPDRRAVGYVAQEGALYPHLDVGENVGFGLPRDERKRGTRTAEVLELVGLGETYARRRVHELSGGEQRRVALARALAPRPRLVLLDEPFSGLDAVLRADTREAVARALSAQGTTALLVTHDQAEALSMGREVAVLRDGRLIQTAAPDVLYRSPVDLYVARFVGAAVVLAGDAQRGTVQCALGRLETDQASVSGEVQVLVRPEQIEVARLNGSRGEGIATARVVDRTYYGAEMVLTLDLDGSEDPISARCYSHEAPAEGDLVRVSVAGPVAVYPRPD
jgi:iron(III) transport system ATP-binding protein